jgi:hypothetical protein
MANQSRFDGFLATASSARRLPFGRSARREDCNEGSLEALGPHRRGVFCHHGPAGARKIPPSSSSATSRRQRQCARRVQAHDRPEPQNSRAVQQPRLNLDEARAMAQKARKLAPDNGAIVLKRPRFAPSARRVDEVTSSRGPSLVSERRAAVRNSARRQPRVRKSDVPRPFLACSRPSPQPSRRIGERAEIVSFSTMGSCATRTLSRGTLQPVPLQYRLSPHHAEKTETLDMDHLVHTA